MWPCSSCPPSISQVPSRALNLSKIAGRAAARSAWGPACVSACLSAAETIGAETIGAKTTVVAKASVQRVVAFIEISLESVESFVLSTAMLEPEAIGDAKTGPPTRRVALHVGGQARERSNLDGAAVK